MAERQAPGGHAFRELTLANGRAILRDRRTFGVVLVMPFAFLGLFLLIDLVTTNGPFSVGVASGDAEVGRALARSSDLRVTPVEVPAGSSPSSSIGSLDALVLAEQGLDGRVQVVSAGSAGPVDAVEAALAETGFPGSRIEATTVDGNEPLDPFRFGLPSVLVLAFSSLVLFGTAVPIITLRERGTLRLLGTTPVSRLTFLLAQAPARLGVAGFQLAVMAGLAAVTGFLDVATLGALLLTATFGLVLLFSLGYLAAGLIDSVELATSALGTLLPFALFLSGIFVPLSILPGGLQDVAPWIPLSYLGDALRQDLVGLPGEYSKATSYAVMFGSSVLATVLAARTFRWDQGE